MPQSTSRRLPAASTRYFEPVTQPAAPKKVSFAIELPFYRIQAVETPQPRVPREKGAGRMNQLTPALLIRLRSLNLWRRTENSNQSAALACLAFARTDSIFRP